MDFSKTYINYVSLLLELAGVSVIVFGAVIGLIGLFKEKSRGENKLASLYIWYRRFLGKSILLGLEFLVAADIINSVAIEPTFQSVGVLAIIVLIRTFLSFTLEAEMDGKWPWQDRKNS